MKTFLKTMLLLVFFGTFQSYAQVQAVPDPNFRAVLIATFPNVDANSDGIITQSELIDQQTATDLVLHFTDSNVLNYDLTGIEHLNCRVVKLYSDLPNQAGNPDGLVSVSNFDLTQLRNTGDVNCGNCGSIQELYLNKISTGTIKIKDALDLKKLTVEANSNIADIGDLSGNSSGSANSLEEIRLINQRTNFSKLDLIGHERLKYLTIEGAYIDTLKLPKFELLSTELREVKDLKVLKLPEKLLTNAGTYYSGVFETLSITNFYTPLNKLENIDFSTVENLRNLTIKCNSPNTTLTNLNISNNTKLEYLNLENLDGLTSLNLNNNTLLNEAHINYFSNLASPIDFNNNVQLTKLECYSNGFTFLDVTKNVALTELNCSNNQLSGYLDLTKNVALTKLDCNTNALPALLLTNNINLEELDCSNNLIEDTHSFPQSGGGATTVVFNLSSNTKLKRLNLSNNKLTKLDVSANAMLEFIDANDNQLKSLNVANGNNANMNSWELNTGVRCLTNPNLTCIYVDANVVNNIPDTWMKDATANYTVIDEISIPDANFKSSLLNHTPVIDTDENGKISTCEAESFTGIINVNNKNISDLTGLEKFVNITGLYAKNNNLSSLNISPLKEITVLDVGYNQLTSLQTNVTNNWKLTDFYINNNQLSGYFATDYMPNLERFDCSNNQLQSIEVTSNTKLKILYSENNPFTSANVNTIDVSQNPDLEQLSCGNNQLEDLDISNNSKLIKLICKDNQLKKLKIANGANATLADFDARFNSQLYCIQVDANIINAIPNTWQVDAIANYSVDACVIAECSETNIPDANFKAALLNHTPRVDLDFDGKIEDCEIDNYTGGIIDVHNKSITDFTGLEKFVNTATFDLSDNPVATIDLSLLGEMTKLTIRNTQITDLDLSNNTKLTQIFAANNSKLAHANIKNGNNQIITDLELNNNPLLAYICVDDATYANAQDVTKWKKDATATYTTNCTLSINDDTLSSVKIYPNPVKNLLHVNVADGETFKTITIYTVLGKKVITSNKETVNVSSLPKGIYLLKVVSTSGKSMQKKMIKL